MHGSQKKSVALIKTDFLRTFCLTLGVEPSQIGFNILDIVVVAMKK